MIDKKTNQEILDQLIKDNQIPAEQVAAAQDDFQWFIENHFKCDPKTHFKNCQQELKGYEIALVYENGRFYQKLVPCAHLLKEQEKKHYLDKFLFTDFDPLKTKDFLFFNNSAEQHKFYNLDENKDWDKIVPYIKDKKEFVWKQQIVNDFILKMKPNIPVTKGIYLNGTMGIGKTNLLKFLAVIAASKYEKTVVFVNTSNLISKVKESFNQEGNTSTRLISKLSETDILFLDDLGAEQVSPWVRDELLFTILNYRMENHKLTYFSSNLSMEKLLTHYMQTPTDPNRKIKTNRLIERIKTLSIPFFVTGEDHRS